MRKIKLCYIDDVRTDRKIFEYEIGEAVLRDVEITTLAVPPQDLRVLLDYDGVLFDQFIRHGGQLGSDLARTLHKLDHFLPIALLTGTQPETIPEDALSFLDRIIWKDKKADHFQNIHNLPNSMRAFVRKIAGSARYQRRVGLCGAS